MVFWHRYNISNGCGLYVDISVNDGEYWTLLKSLGSENNNSVWWQEEINLSSYKDQGDILINFRLVSDSSITTGDGWYIDDVSIIELPIISYADFHDDAETEPSLLFPNGSWAKVTLDSYSASHCWTDSPGGNYNNNVNTVLTTKHISLVGSIQPYLTFWHRYDIDNTGYDYGSVEISTDDGDTWHILKTFRGTYLTWQQENINLYTYKNNGNFLIRFRLYSDSSGTSDGWYIDDVNISDMP